jgi:hypothetical protein
MLKGRIMLKGIILLFIICERVDNYFITIFHYGFSLVASASTQHHFKK